MEAPTFRADGFFALKRARHIGCLGQHGQRCGSSVIATTTGRARTRHLARMEPESTSGRSRAAGFRAFVRRPTICAAYSVVDEWSLPAIRQRSNSSKASHSYCTGTSPLGRTPGVASLAGGTAMILGGLYLSRVKDQHGSTLCAQWSRNPATACVPCCNLSFS